MSFRDKRGELCGGFSRLLIVAITQRSGVIQSEL
jgi:hypothetical protein